MFIGRKNELQLIKEEIKKNSSSILVYGKRKIGKTTLIKEACKDSGKIFIYFECIKDTVQENINLFIYQLKKMHLMDDEISLESLNFISLFNYLNSLGKKIIVVIDEYPYLKVMNNPQTIDSIFQSIIDNNISNINLFISGSHVAMMNTLLSEKNALYGRFKKIIKLEELNYLEASEFYIDKTPYEKVQYYAIFGGSPYILSSLDYSKSIKENIITSFLDIRSSIYVYADNFLLTDYANPIQTMKLLAFLKNGKHKYSEIEQVMDPKKTGNLSRILKPLIDMNLITKKYPINKLDNRKYSFYEINDNVLRFFNTYIARNKSLMVDSNNDEFFNVIIEPSLNTYISYRFEDIVKQYFRNEILSGRYNNALIVGTYFYNDHINKTNGELDIVIRKKDTFDIYEAKYLNNKLSINDINKEISQIKNIKDLKIDNIGFVSINGFEEDIKTNNFKKISGNQLYKSN